MNDTKELMNTAADTADNFVKLLEVYMDEQDRDTRKILKASVDRSSKNLRQLLNILEENL